MVATKAKRSFLLPLAIGAFLLVAVIAAGSALAGRHVAVASSTVTVSPSGMNGWGFFDDNGFGGATGFVSGPDSPPLGSGSASLIVHNSSQGVAFGTQAFIGTHMSNIDTLAYSTYRVSGASALASALQFDVDYDLTDGNTSFQGRLIFEPYYTNTVLTGSWQTWDTLTSAGSGNWWASKPPGNGFCPIGNPCTWSEVLGHFPNAGVRATSGVLLLKAGSGWTSFQGSADNLQVGVSGNTTTYDFEAEPCSADCYVNGATGDDSFDGAAPFTAKKTVQGGVDAVSSGGTVHVAAGTYTEVGQIVINKSVSIVGAGAGTTIIKPSADTGSSGDDGRGWFLVNPGFTFNLSKVTLDGTGRKVWQAIRDKGQGTISDCAFTNIKFEESGPSYAGTGMAVFGSPAMNVNVTNCTFSGIGRVGVLYFGSGVTGSTFSGNTYTGKGAGDWLDYAVEVGGGAHATIMNNPISNNTGVASVDGSTSAGILVTTFFGGGTQATITGNTISGSTAGIAVGYDSSDTSVVTASLNNISAPVADPSAGLDAIGAVSLNVHNNTFTGGYDAIKLRPGVTGTIANNAVSGYAKNGITVGKAADDNTGTNVTVSGNTVTGGGPGEVNAQNGIQVGPNAVATIKDNSVSNHVYTLGAGSCAGPGTKADAAYYAACYTAAGILVYQGTATITGNVISGNQVGVDVASSAEIHYNQFLNNVIYGVNNNTVPVIDAENNWWGACDGPGPVGLGSGDGVSANVDYTPWSTGPCDPDNDLLSNDQETLIYGTDPNNPDTDGDHCKDGREVLPISFYQQGGGRNPLNHWDYFNPSGDGQNRVDDILLVVHQYFKDDTDGNPGLPPYSPGYNVETDRTLAGPELWRTGPANGQQRVDDILNMINQYFLDCA